MSKLVSKNDKTLYFKIFIKKDATFIIFFLYLNILKTPFKHFLKMIFSFDNLLNLFVPFAWHFTQCHFSSLL